MNSELNFDAEILTSEVMQKLNIPIVTRKPIKKAKTIQDMSESKLITNVKVEDLVIDLTYQRSPSREKVGKIVREFDPNALGVIICSMRENGVVAVIDGGHRVSALNIMGLGSSDIRCLVFFGLTLNQEAEMFSILNDNRTKPKTSDIFKSKVIAKDEQAVEINNMLIKYGLRVGNQAGLNIVRAIGTLNTIYKKYGLYVLDQTVHSLTNAFGTHSTSYTDEALYAVSEIIAGSSDIINYKRLSETLKMHNNVSLWYGKGSSIAKQAGFKKIYHGMIFVLVNDYNKRLKSKRIDFNKIVK